MKWETEAGEGRQKVEEVTGTSLHPPCRTGLVVVALPATPPSDVAQQKVSKSLLSFARTVNFKRSIENPVKTSSTAPASIPK